MDGICHCGHLTVQRTACTEANAGRRFFGCAKGSAGCGFFRWSDPPPLTARGRTVIMGLLRWSREMKEIRIQEIEAMNRAHLAELRILKVHKKSGVPWGSVLCFVVIVMLVLCLGGAKEHQ